MLQLKKLSRVVLAMLVGGSLLLSTACGDNSTPSQATPPAADDTSVADTSTPETPEETSTAATEGEAPVVRWICAGDPQPKQQEVMARVNEILLEKYNIQLNFETYDFGSYEDKINMIISSNEDYDICWTSEGWINKFLPNINRGAFMPLDDLIENNAPGLKDILPEFLFEQARVGGSIYAIPNYQICYNSFGFSLQKELVDKYDFDYENVKSWEDMYPFWDQIAANEPDLYGIGMSQQNYSTKAFINDYYSIATLEDVRVKLDDSDYKVHWYPDVEKESRLNVRDWFERGYIRSDAMTVLDDSADIKSGKYASYMEVVKPGGAIERAANTGGIEHVQVAVQTPFIGNTASRGTMTAISSSSKQPEAAIKMIEIMNSDEEIYNMINFGIEGTNYNLVDGFVEEIQDSGYFYNTAWAVGNQFNALLKVGQAPGIWEETDRINRSATVSPVSGFSFDAESVSSEIAQISSVIDEYKFIEFGDNFDAKFDEYQTKLEQAGIEKYCEEVQKQLDEWLIANGKK